AANQLWVADITYIPLECGGTCYLHIVTDAYSHKVVGYKVSPSLRASESLDALRQAIAHAVALRGTDSLDGLVHHSDRGVQYCCDAYI
ncbi:DDE-type integrase/transposase/recombinase, partial [Marseilla massiliensis]